MAHGGIRVEGRTRAQVRAAADDARRAFGYSGTTPDLIDIVEHGLFKLGVVVDVVEDFMLGDALAGTYPETDEIWIRHDVYDALLAGDEQARYTISHELGHLWMHNVPVAALRRMAPPGHARYEDAEWQADAFAEEFMMPAAVVKGLCKSATDIARLFKVPFPMAMRRFKDLQMEGFIPR